jgi:hypothetical protein
MQAKFALSGKTLSETQKAVNDKIKVVEGFSKRIYERFTRTHAEFGAFQNACRSSTFSNFYLSLLLVPTMIRGIAEIKGRLALTLSQLAHIENNFSDMFNFETNLP